MKKISVNILCDEFYVADSLRELASNIECGDLLDGMEYGSVEVSGDHYTADVKIVNIEKTPAEKLYAIMEAARTCNFKDEIEDIDILEYQDKDGEIHEDRFDYIDTTTIPMTVKFIGGTGHGNISVPLRSLATKSIDMLYNMIND